MECRAYKIKGFAKQEEIKLNMEELLITPAVIMAMETMDLIIRSGAYEEPPAHNIVKR